MLFKTCTPATLFLLAPPSSPLSLPPPSLSFPLLFSLLPSFPLQLYVVQVTCRNGSQYTIFRRYRQFDEMQRLLEQRFPVEAGEFNQKERVLPHLPGKVVCRAVPAHPLVFLFLLVWRQCVCSGNAHRSITAPPLSLYGALLLPPPTRPAQTPTTLPRVQTVN